MKMTKLIPAVKFAVVTGIAGLSIYGLMKLKEEWDPEDIQDCDLCFDEGQLLPTLSGA